jgi:UDP-N-acetylglucosamine 2-epimerase (non-hydrolysing)
MKILIIIGTRPEAIKMAPVIHTLEKDLSVKVCVTGQHREMLDQVLDIFKIRPHYDLNIMIPGQDLFDVTSSALLGIKKVLLLESPDLVLVHGDTTTSMVAAMAAFYLNIQVGHVEAGLRTNDLYSPFPEEFNRQIVGKIASYHFAPTDQSRQNLLLEGVSDEKIVVTGNTVIDALFSVIEEARKMSFSKEILKTLDFFEKKEKCKIVLITGHRRENFGSGFEEICQALLRLAQNHPEVKFVYPVHPNPNVREPVTRILSKIKNIYLISPQGYLPFIKLMDASYLVLTDSGGIQEEAPSLGKPVLVMRNTTERPEAVEAGTAKLVGANCENIVREVDLLLTDKNAYKNMSTVKNPYGVGNACEKILKKIKKSKGI